MHVAWKAMYNIQYFSTSHIVSQVRCRGLHTAVMSQQSLKKSITWFWLCWLLLVRDSTRSMSRDQVTTLHYDTNYCRPKASKAAFAPLCELWVRFNSNAPATLNWFISYCRWLQICGLRNVARSVDSCWWLKIAVSFVILICTRFRIIQLGFTKKIVSFHFMLIWNLEFSLFSGLAFWPTRSTYVTFTKEISLCKIHYWISYWKSIMSRNQCKFKDEALRSYGAPKFVTCFESPWTEFVELRLLLVVYFSHIVV